MKYHVAFIVSNEPIDLSLVQPGRNVRHLIQAEFDHSEVITLEGGRNFRINKAAPEYCQGSLVLHTGTGASVSVVIADWIKALCRSGSYLPLYKKRSE